MALYDIDITCNTGYVTVHSLSEACNICWNASHVYSTFYQEITLGTGGHFGVVTYDDKLIFSLTPYFTEQSEHIPVVVVRYIDKSGNFVEKIIRSYVRFTTTVSDTPSKSSCIKTSAKLGGARKLISLWEVAA